MARTLKIRRGNKADLPALAQGEPGMTLDEGRLYLGTGSANISIPNAADLSKLSASLSNKANGSFTLYSNLSQLGLTEATASMTSIIAAMKSSSILVAAVTTAFSSEEFPSQYATLTISKRDPSRASATLISNASSGMWFGSMNTVDPAMPFDRWTPIAMATPPMEYDLPIINCTGTVKYSKTQESVVTIPDFCVTTSAAIASGGKTATLPSGHYPAKQLKIAANLGSNQGQIIISTAGAITVSAAVPSGAVICAGSISYAAAT